MSIVACTQCRRVIQIGGDPKEVMGLLGSQDSFPCVTPLCSGRLQKLRPGVSIEGFTSEELPVKSFFRGIHGFGTLEGEAASLARARELLITGDIVDLVGESTGKPERVIIRQLVLKNGTKLHFDTSSKGACLYYIEEPSPSCVEVFDNELSSGTTTESPDSDREEDGRVAEACGESRDEAGELADSTSTPEQPESRGVPSVPTSSGVPEDADPERTRDGDHPDLRVRADTDN